MVIVEEMLVDSHRVRQVEGPDAEDFFEIDLGVARPEDLRRRVEPAYACLQRADLIFIDEVGLVENDAVRADDLIDRLIVDTVKSAVVEMGADMLGVYQRQDPVDRCL